MKRNILFLLRTYNDIDHIAPVIWKAAKSGCGTFFLFVGEDYSEDYRIRFLLDLGASRVRSSTIEWYHASLRPMIAVSLLRKIVDRLVSYTVGVHLLKRWKTQVIVTEWCGPYGREKAIYYLQASGLLALPTYSLPHGYLIFTNPQFNRLLTKKYKSNREVPDFAERNWYTKYVVQSEEHKSLNIAWGMINEKLVVLGSARFCREWSEINQRLLLGNEKTRSKSKRYRVIFFLPHWDYNVHREKCIKLLEMISRLTDVYLEVKAHTRGSGSLTTEEINRVTLRGNASFINEGTHSTELVNRADVVISFGSSVGFEALRQEKLMINPTYLHDNQTIFDETNVVIDASDEQSVVQAIVDHKLSQNHYIDRNLVQKFLQYRVDAGFGRREVLQDYVDLLCE